MQTPKKYYTKLPVNIDGRDYNPGEIIYTLNPAPCLVRMYDEESPASVKIDNDDPRMPSYNELCGANDPVISVVITFHKQKKFARECLESFTRQTINVPYEIVAVLDDEVDDGTEYLITSEYHLKVFYVRVNHGNASKSRNEGYTYTRPSSKYICYFDGDDFAYPEYLEQLYNALEKNPDAGFAYARFKHELYGFYKGLVPRCNSYEWSKSAAKYTNIVNTPSMIRRAALEEMPEQWSEEIDILQDLDFNLKLAKVADGIHIPKELWRYRHHDNSVWNKDGAAAKREFAMGEIKKNGFKPDVADYTFVSLISRMEVAEEYFKQIPQLGMPKTKTHWLIIVDTDEQELVDFVKEKQRQYEKYFLSSRMYVTWLENLAESRSFLDRGMRIANIIKTIVNMLNEPWIGTPYLFMVEDDTIAPKDAFKDLLKVIKEKPGAAYVSGIEIGRGYTKHTGVCTLSETAGTILERHIPKMKYEGVDPIHGGGWYCWIGRVEMLGNITYRCEDGKMLGPDVLMVYDLVTKHHREAYVVWSVQCKHYSPSLKRYLECSEGKGYEITYHKEAGKWEYKLNELK